MPKRLPPHPDPEVEAARQRDRDRKRDWRKANPDKAAKHSADSYARNRETFRLRRRTENLTCPGCSVPFRGRKGQRFCSKACAALVTYSEGTRKPSGRKGPKSALWRGGRTVNRSGYVEVWVPEETPGRNSSTGRMLEHRLLMQNHLGRPLKRGESVHHRNAVRDDNRLENLQIMAATPHRGEVACPHCQNQFLIR